MYHTYIIDLLFTTAEYSRGKIIDLKKIITTTRLYFILFYTSISTHGSLGENGMKHMKKSLAIICILLVMAIVSANSTEHIVDALENIKVLDVQEAFTGDALNIISTSKIYEATLGFEIPESGSIMSISRYALKDKGTITLFNSEYELISSVEFLASISPDFTLKNVEDGLLFQEFFYAVDEQYFNEGFFIEGNQWIFVRDEFFGELEVWTIETDECGTITTITHEYDVEYEMPDERFENSDMSFRYEEHEENQIPQDIFAYIESSMSNDFVYEIEVSPIISGHLEKVSKASWYDCTLSIIEEDEYGTFTSIHELIAVEHNKEVSFYENINDFFSSEAFLMSMQESFLLTDEKSAELFELALDQVSNFERKEKARFERNGNWVFIRDEFFDDGRGFNVNTDERGLITHIEYSWEIPLEGIEVPVEEIFDESLVDWNFSLIEPQNRDIELSFPLDTSVIIEVNDWAANQMGAWIGTFKGDEWVGMYASTEMESPFYDTIPGEILDYGENNISYKLLRPGNDYDNPIEQIDLSITVIEQDFDDSLVTWNFTLVEPQNRELHILEPRDISVEIEFNDEEARDMGVWIGTFYKGRMVEMYAGSDITSPFYGIIPGDVLEDGGATVTYKLLRPGKDYDNPLKEVDVSVWVD